jgi:hypothetical protein
MITSNTGVGNLPFNNSKVKNIRFYLLVNQKILGFFTPEGVKKYSK